MILSIIIVNYNVYEDVKTCIRNIYNSLRIDLFEIIVIDNNSPDRSVENIRLDFPDVKFIGLDENIGFGAANNVAFDVARGDYILLINPDIIILGNTIEILLNNLSENAGIGVVAPVLRKPEGGIEYYYTFFPSLYSRIMQEFGLFLNAKKMKRRIFNFLDVNILKGKPFFVDWAMGACMMFRKQLTKEIGKFDEAFFLYEEETEWQYRLREKGWRSIIIPSTYVIHNHHSSASKLGRAFIHFQEFRSRIIFSNKHDTWFILILKKILTSVALLLRLIVNAVKSVFSFNSYYKRKTVFNWELIKFNFSNRNKIINSRFSFKDYKLRFS